MRTLLLSYCLLCGCSERSAVAAPAALVRALDQQAEVRVLVSLREPPPGSDRVRSIAQHRDAVLARSGREVVVARQFRHVSAFSASITRAALSALQRDPEVSAIELDLPGRGALAEAVPAIAADTVQRVLGLSGRGVRVALLDTGVDLQHPDLRGAVVGQHCFSSGGCPPYGRSEGGSAQDDNGHGTAVAGVLASRGQVAPRGFAPEVEIVAVKVQSSDNRGVSSDWVAGLDWVYDNLRALQVDVVLMSVGTDLLFDQVGCEQALGALNRAINNLVRAGVPVIVSSGNAGSAMTLPAPACLPGVIAVGASYDSDLGAQPSGAGSYASQLGETFAACRDEQTSSSTFACFTNSSPDLDVLAPGAPIVTSARGGRAQQVWGTSAAAAAAAGVSALLRQCNPTLRPAELRELLRSTGTPSGAGAQRPSFPIVHALRAVQAACPTLPGVASAGSGGAPAVAAAGSGGASTPSAAAGSGGGVSAVGGAGAPAAAIGGSGGAGGAAPATGARTGAATAAGADAPREPEAADAGSPRTIPIMPYVPKLGSLPAQERERDRGCSVASPGAERTWPWWPGLLGLLALVRRRQPSARRSSRPSRRGGQK